MPGFPVIINYRVYSFKAPPINNPRKFYSLVLSPNLLKIISICHEHPLREKYSYSEFFWSIFSHIWTECGPNAGNTDQKTSQYGHFSQSGRRDYSIVFFAKPFVTLNTPFYKQFIFDPRPENYLSFSRKSPQKIV